MTNVQRRAESTGDAVNDIAKSVDKGVSDTTGMMMGACKDGDVEEIGASVTAWVGNESG